MFSIIYSTVCGRHDRRAWSVCLLQLRSSTCLRGYVECCY